MGLTLTSRDQARLRRMIHLLLSPMAFDRTGDWCAAVERAMRVLLRAEHSIFLLPTGHGFKSDGATAYVHAEPGAGAADCHAGPPVCAAALALNPLVRQHVGLRLLLPGGEVKIGVGYNAPERCPWRRGELRQLLELLAPAFAAGVYQVLRASSWTAELGRALDDLGTAALVVDAHGGELHRTERLRQLLRDAPEADLLLGAMRLTAREVLVAGELPAGTGAVTILDGGRSAGTPEADYRLRGARLRGVAERAVAIVVADPVAPMLPSPQELTGLAGLTPREATIAVLLARGGSDSELANRLSISQHTVRTHTMHIFRKLHLHTRKALALRLWELRAAEPVRRP
jgi:DNA-binding CsgD family transcriptional regulator